MNGSKLTKILLVEDESSISEPLSYLLEKEGYDVVIAADGRTALNLFLGGDIDLILLDLMLPGMSGVDVCREVRSQSQVPIIMLTAKDSEVDIVVGLELGADDYVTKPYSSRELLARIKSVLRRYNEPEEANSTLDVAGISMDLDRHSVHVRGEEVSMPLREYELLELLMRNAGRV